MTEHLACRRLAPGDALFRQDDTDTSLYVIAAGIVEITRKSGEFSQSLGYLGAGDYVGEIGLLTGAAHAATAIARSPCVAYQLPHEAMEPLMKQSANLSAELAKAAQKGLDLLHREVAVRAAPDVGGPAQLLARIKDFFRFAPP